MHPNALLALTRPYLGARIVRPQQQKTPMQVMKDW
jgi:hypothetical protein